MLNVEMALKLKKLGFSTNIFSIVNLTVEEILIELPNEIDGYILEISRYEDGLYYANYKRGYIYCDDCDYLIFSVESYPTLVEALANLWIYLKENKYI
jgi:hypothetical protein